MESLPVMGEEKRAAEMEYLDEPMDVNETPSDVYCEEGEINSTDDEKSVTVQMPSNVSGIFTRHYRKDQTGGFVTGFNIFDKDETEKKMNRAKRFCLPVQTADHEDLQREKLFNLHRDLGINKENERHYRFNTVHMRGTENMSTDDVLQYFISYAPSHVEWINDISCNVVWMDDISAARALLNLSKKIKNLDKVHLNADPFEKDFKDDSPSEDVNDEEAVDAREVKTAIPPGYWRIGVPCEKSSFLLLRYANRSDKKQRNAEKNSEYYKKYGNPHYGNIPGLISNSFRYGIKKSRIKVPDSNPISGRFQEQRLDKKNPWEELAFEWGKSDKVEDTEHNFIRSNIAQRKSQIPDLRISLTNKKGMGKRTRSDSDTSPNSSDRETWERRSKVPRMKMYADDEEKKLEKNLEKRFQGDKLKKHPEQDLRSKINKKKVRPRLKFRSEKKIEAESSESSSTENDYDDGDSGDWALEHYHDLRNSLRQNRRRENQKYKLSYESCSEDDDDDDEDANVDDLEAYEGNLRQRSPLQIEIENDEYYLNKD